MKTLSYTNTQDSTTWHGIQLADGSEFNTFLVTEVASRLHDYVGKADFTSHLNSLVSTGFEKETLQIMLEAEHPEERDWAVGEALAEAWLSHEHGVIWPWNMERDKRTPKASLPGADLIGFVVRDDQTYLVLGEVKSSSDKNAPPNIMHGCNGMAHQLENLSKDISILHTIFRWLLPRCRNNSFEPHFNAAFKLLLQSDGKAMALFGVLVRDTQPSEQDLCSRGRYLGSIIQTPASCHLLALYLPCNISSLPSRIQQPGGET